MSSIQYFVNSNRHSRPSCSAASLALNSKLALFAHQKVPQRTAAHHRAPSKNANHRGTKPSSPPHNYPFHQGSKFILFPGVYPRLHSAAGVRSFQLVV